jgi:hypothetical protein
MTDVLERGNIYFVYRPAVGETRPKGRQDLQRFYMVLKPRERQTIRVVVIGQKRMPEVQDESRNWGFVDLVSSRPEEIAQTFGPMVYETQTRGDRHVPGVRVAGEGVYAIARHDDHTHLAYALDEPRDPGNVQRELGIEKEASYVLTVKNPEASSPPGAGLEASEKAELPAELQERFRGRRFVPADPPEFLDFRGTEVLLIGARDDVGQELGLDLESEAERADSESVFRELRVARDQTQTEPLFKGEWR